MSNEAVIVTTVTYQGWPYQVTIKDRDIHTVVADIKGKFKTIKAIWNPEKHPDRPFLVGRRNDDLALHVKAILTMVLETLIPANHPGSSTDTKDEEWISQMVLKGHFRRPCLRRLPNGQKIIVAGCVVNGAGLTDKEREALCDQVYLWTKVAKAFGVEVKTWSQAKKLDAELTKKLKGGK